MAFLIVGGVTIAVRGGGVRHEVEEFGERVRAFDGTIRTAVRARKNRWGPLATTLLPRATADTLIGVLNGTPPVACSGDLLNGSVNCHPQYEGLEPASVANGVTMWRVLFTLHEA